MRLDAFAEAAAGRAASRAYRFGIAGGVAIVWLLAGAVAGLLAAFTASGNASALAAVAAAAGALGGAISVSLRSAGRHALDVGLGKGSLVSLGLFRPLVGCIFGLVLFFVVRVVLEPPLAAVIVLGFVGGFGERWTQVILASAVAHPPG